MSDGAKTQERCGKGGRRPVLLEAALPVYAACDRRQDGRPRIIAEFVDLNAATLAADSLRAAGAEVDVVLVTGVRN